MVSSRSANEPKRMFHLRLSLKSSTRMISWIRCSGLLFSTLKKEQEKLKIRLKSEIKFQAKIFLLMPRDNCSSAGTVEHTVVRMVGKVKSAPKEGKNTCRRVFLTLGTSLVIFDQ